MSKYVPTDADKIALKSHKIGWHKTGGWCRKFPGEINRTYFGHVPPDEAIRRHNAAESKRLHGEPAEAAYVSLRLREAVNLFLAHLDAQHRTGAIGDEQRASYGQELLFLIQCVGRNRNLSDFCLLSAPELLFAPMREKAWKRGVFAAEKCVVQVRTFLDWCNDKRRFIPPPFYGGKFDPPSTKEKRAAKRTTRREKGTASWSVDELREIIAAAKATSVHHHAWVLLGLNGGMGSTDLALLEDADVDWQRQCIDTERSKTLVPRVIPLWPETVAAMKLSREARATPARREWAGRFFLTPKGRPLVTRRLGDDQRSKRTDSVRNWFYTLLHGEKRRRWKQPAIRLTHLGRHGAGAYTLRSAFLSLARGHGGDSNLDAVIAGHKLSRPILETYLRGDYLAKLRAITDHVRSQIFTD